MRRAPAAFALYLLASVAMFGRDVLRSPDDRIVGDDGADKSLYLWSLEWWPRAVLRGHNPLDVDVVWAPHGFDLGLGTAGGGLALAAAPLTAVLGPVVTYNALILLAPALAATTAFLLAERITGAFWPSLAAGWIFGFSSYETGRILGHLPLAFVALVPLVPYLILRRHAGELSRRAFVAALAAVLVAQFTIVTQLFFTLAVVGACAAVAAYFLLDRGRALSTARESALAFAAALVLVSPVVTYAFLSDAAAPVRSPYAESADVLNYVVPTRRTWIRPPGSEEVTARFTATGTEQGAYLGVPLLALAALALARRPLPRPRLLLGVLFAVAGAISLGTRPKIAGEVFAIGPWSLVAPLPVVGSALPARFTVYTSLFAGLLVALALADRSSRVRWGLALAGLVLTLPNLGLPQWSSDVPRPRFFELGRDELHLTEGADGARPPVRAGRLVAAVAGRGRLPLRPRRRALRAARHPCRGEVARRLRGREQRAGRRRAAARVPREPLRRRGRGHARDARRRTTHARSRRGQAAGPRVRQPRLRGQTGRMRSRRSSGRSRNRRRVRSLRSSEYAQPTYPQRGQLPDSSFRRGPGVNGLDWPQRRHSTVSDSTKDVFGSGRGRCRPSFE